MVLFFDLVEKGVTTNIRSGNFVTVLKPKWTINNNYWCFLYRIFFRFLVIMIVFGEC